MLNITVIIPNFILPTFFHVHHCLVCLNLYQFLYHVFYKKGVDLTFNSKCELYTLYILCTWRFLTDSNVNKFKVNTPYHIHIIRIPFLNTQFFQSYSRDFPPIKTDWRDLIGRRDLYTFFSRSIREKWINIQTINQRDLQTH